MPRLSNDRVSALAAEITAALKKEPGVVFKQMDNAVKMGVVRALHTDLKADDKLSAAAKAKVASMKNRPPEDSPQYKALLDQFYRAEMTTLRKIR